MLIQRLARESANELRSHRPTAARRCRQLRLSNRVGAALPTPRQSSGARPLRTGYCGARRTVGRSRARTRIGRAITFERQRIIPTRPRPIRSAARVIVIRRSYIHRVAFSEEACPDHESCVGDDNRCLPARPHRVDGLEDTRLHSELIKFMGRHKSSDTSPTTSTSIAGLRTSFDKCCPRP
jgi:hypothetical protein